MLIASDVSIILRRCETFNSHEFLTGKQRNTWEELYLRCDGIIFVLDSSDALRLAVVKEELALMLSHEDFKHKPVPILFLANKMDIGAIDCTSFMNALGLSDICDRRWKIYSSNAVTGEGLADAIGWFASEIKNCTKRYRLTT